MNTQAIHERIAQLTKEIDDLTSEPNTKMNRNLVGEVLCFKVGQRDSLAAVARGDYS